MNLRKLFFLIISTIGVGIIVGIFHSITRMFAEIGLVWGAGTGGFVATTALMGFWAYLTLNYMVEGLLPQTLWRWIQGLVVLVVYVDFIYLRYSWGGQTGSIWPYVGFATWPLVIAMLVAFWKVKLSGKTAFFPAVFFLYVFTIIEWSIALKFNQSGVSTVLGSILLACNSYLILILGRLLRRS